MVTVNFDWKLETKIDLSLINLTNTLIYVQPSEGREHYENFNESDIAILWNLSRISNN